MTNNKKNTFGQFYVTYKIHKGQKDNRWLTRPVCSDVRSITHSLRKWVDQMLQPIASGHQSYLKDSFVLEETISKLHLPPSALLFTCDAKSMYANISTELALTVISNYIAVADGKFFHHYNSQAFIVIQFGHTYWQQTSGTGMGISPASPWATIFYALHENTFLPKYRQHLIFYKCFIDNVFGVLLPHPCQHQNQILWHTFKDTCKNGMDLNGN